MGIFAGLGKAEIFERGNYVKGGFDGVVLIKKTIAKDTVKSGLAFIVEMEVLETNMPNDHKTGSKVTWFQSMKTKTVAFSSIAAWAAACAGYEPHQKDEIERDVMPIIEDLCEEAIVKSDDNHFTGIKLRLKTWMTVTKERKVDFTVYEFHPMEQK